MTMRFISILLTEVTNASPGLRATTCVTGVAESFRAHHQSRTTTVPATFGRHRVLQAAYSLGKFLCDKCQIAIINHAVLVRVGATVVTRLADSLAERRSNNSDVGAVDDTATIQIAGRDDIDAHARGLRAVGQTISRDERHSEFLRETGSQHRSGRRIVNEGTRHVTRCIQLNSAQNRSGENILRIAPLNGGDCLRQWRGWHRR